MAVAIVILPMLASCEKVGSALFRGNYSFKTSGSITAVRDSAYIYDTTYTVNGFQIDTIVTEHSEPMTFNINHEAGQMDITEINSEDNTVVITMNVTGGGIIVYYATAEGSSISLDETVRHITLTSTSLSSDGGELDGKFISTDITINGAGEMYDNIALFNLDYAGDFWCNDRLYHITDCDIVCRAKRNE